MVEQDAVEVLSDTPRGVHFEGTSHTAYLCDDCGTYVWSVYAGMPSCRFVRVGVLEDTAACPPDVHIYTTTKQPWVVLPDDAPRFDEFYDLGEVWSADALARLKASAETG